MGVLPNPREDRLGRRRLRRGHDRQGAQLGEEQPNRGGPVGDAELAYRFFDVAVDGLGRDVQLTPDIL
jgi:hypothetical protein